MKLADLDPAFLSYRGDGISVPVRKIRNADGIHFVCPKCYAAAGNRIEGVHRIRCWTPRVPDDIAPGPGRWSLTGKSLRDVTLDGARGKSRSVLLLGGCKWHGYVTNGEVTDA